MMTRARVSFALIALSVSMLNAPLILAMTWASGAMSRPSIISLTVSGDVFGPKRDRKATDQGGGDDLFHLIAPIFQCLQLMLKFMRAATPPLPISRDCA